MNKVIGIDLGTTNSCVAVLEGGEPVVIPSAFGERITPSVVSVNPAGQLLVGTPAKRSAIIDAENTVLSIKRFMGRKFHDGTRERDDAARVGTTISSIKRFMGVKIFEPSVEEDSKYVSYKVDEGDRYDIRVWLGDRPYSPPEVSAMILRQLRTDAEAYLGEEVTQAVITVPAYFNDSQRQATKDAGAIAGLDVLRIVNEPTAAALAYGLQHKSDQLIAVFDLGGGTFDISILELCEGTFEVKAVNGDTHLGGDDIDRHLMEWLCQRFQDAEGIDLRKDRMALQRLRDACEKAKMRLSADEATEINLPFISLNGASPKHLVAPLTRSELESLAADVAERAILRCQQALDDAGVGAADLAQVVLVGGQTRMPLVRDSARRFFRREPHTGLNPEEVVAIGAAVQAGVLTGEIKDVLLLDVTPLTLSIETQGGIATPLIRRNSTIPTSAGKIFTTAEDNQPNVEINVVQGERTMAVENRSLGRFCLEDIPPAPRGAPQIEVTFSIDADGIVQARARDTATGREQGITAAADGGLSAEEIERLKAEAEQFSGLDAGRHQEIHARNEADTAIHLAERALALRREDMTPDIAATVESRVARLRAALRGQSVMRIQVATQELKAVLPAPFLETAECQADVEAGVGAPGLRSEPLER
jgi:molecular chaperone DnaK